MFEYFFRHIPPFDPKIQLFTLENCTRARLQSPCCFPLRPFKRVSLVVHNVQGSNSICKPSSLLSLGESCLSCSLIHTCTHASFLIQNQTRPNAYIHQQLYTCACSRVSSPTPTCTHRDQIHNYVNTYNNILYPLTVTFMLAQTRP